jgi:hypothetical protein
MSFKECIAKNIGTADELTARQRDDLLKQYDDLYDKYSQTLGEEYAEQAARDFVAVKQQQILDENRAAKKHIVMQKQLRSKLEGQLAEKEKSYSKLNKAAKAVERKPSIHHEIGDLYQDVMTRQDTITRTSMIKIVDFFDEHASRMAGFIQDTENLPNVVRAIMGDRTGNDAADIHGQKIRELFDEIHTMYRQAGGSLGKIDNYFPVHHNKVKIQDASFDEWKDYMLPLLDRERMIDLDTGLPMGDKELIEQMKGDYDAIITNGMSDMAQRLDEGKVTSGRGGDVFKRKQQGRFYHFKDPDAFLEYNGKFGFDNGEGLYNAITGHIAGMARDIALMQKLGPKPNAMARYFDFMMEAKGVGQNQRRFVNGSYNLMSGRYGDMTTASLLYRMVEGSKSLARFFLGSATISAVTDTAFVRMALKMNGFKEVKAIKRYFSGLNPADKRTQRSMQRFTTVMSHVNSQSLQGARFMDDVTTNGGKVLQSVNFVSNAILRASGLGKLTDQGRMAVMEAAMGEFDEFRISNTQWSSVDSNMKALMKRYGLGKKEFDIIKKSVPYDDESGQALPFITGGNILDIEGVDKKTLLDISVSYDDMITHLSNQAVNEPTLRTRTITTGAAMGEAQTGSALRGTVSALMAFKSFPITVMQNFLFPLARQAATGDRQAMLNMATTFAFTTIVGGMVVQAKILNRGETPRDMDDPKFWMAAAMQGGGMGIFGDFLFDDYSRFGKSLASTLGGPVVQTWGDALRAVQGNMVRAIDSEQETKFINDSWNVVKKFIPAATLWYVRLPMERIMINSVDELLDPDFKKKVRRKESALRKQGQEYWWSPEDRLPE